MDFTKNVGAPQLSVASIDERDLLFQSGRAVPLVGAMPGTRLQRLRLGFGWTTNSQAIQAFGMSFGKRRRRANFDGVVHAINVSAGRLGVAATSNGDKENLDLFDGAFKHSLDDTSGAVSGDAHDNEWVEIDFGRMPTDIVGGVAMFDSAMDKPFSQVLSRAHCRVTDLDTNREMTVVRPQISTLGTNTMLLLAFAREKQVFGGVEGYHPTNWVMQLFAKAITTQGDAGLLETSVSAIAQIGK